jgi:hypothetical protein
MDDWRAGGQPRKVIRSSFQKAVIDIEVQI